MIIMSIPTIDKVTITNVVAALIIVAYLAYRVLYPTLPVPVDLSTYVNIAIGWFFATGSIAVYAKATKTQ